MKKFTKHLILAMVGAAFMFACASEEKKPADQQQQQNADKSNLTEIDLTALASLIDNNACAALFINVDQIVKKSGLTETCNHILYSIPQR